MMMDSYIRRIEHYCCASEDELFELGEQLGPRFSQDMAVLLKGTLGAGKTLLVRGVASAFGLAAGEVVSPTFAIVQEYPHFIHSDLYRLKSIDEWYELGIYTMLGRKLTFIEWPQLVEAELELPCVDINISITQELGRCVDVSWPVM